MTDNVERCLLIVKKVELFCKRYNRWPYNKKTCSCAVDKTAKGLYNNLFQIGYLGELEFKDYTLRNEFGELIIDVLDRLYNQYSVKIQLSFITQKVMDIKRYCSSYQKWPEVFLNPTTHQEIMASRCRQWLDKNGFVPNDITSFSYRNLKDKNGKLIFDGLADLFFKMQKNLTSEKVSSMVEAIVDFCDVYHRWPAKDGEEAERDLAMWLEDKDGYLSHKEELYGDEIKVKDIIEHYRLTYDETADANLVLYQELVKKAHYMFKSFDDFKDFQNIVLREISKNNLNVTFQDLALEIVLPINERVIVYQKRYEEFKELGLDYLRNLYYNLYLYGFFKSKVEFIGQVRQRKK